MSSLVTPQANLSLQIVILALLFISLALKRIGKHLLHGASMLVAAILNLLSFFAIMWPSFNSLREFLIIHTNDRIALVILGHAILGSVAEILAILLIAFWGFRSSAQNCFKRKKLMRVTLVLWIVALVLGILFYALAYTSILG